MCILIYSRSVPRIYFKINSKTTDFKRNPWGRVSLQISNSHVKFSYVKFNHMWNVFHMWKFYMWTVPISHMWKFHICNHMWIFRKGKLVTSCHKLLQICDQPWITSANTTCWLLVDRLASWDFCVWYRMHWRSCRDKKTSDSQSQLSVKNFG